MDNLDILTSYMNDRKRQRTCDGHLRDFRTTLNYINLERKYYGDGYNNNNALQLLLNINKNIEKDCPVEYRVFPREIM